MMNNYVDLFIYQYVNYYVMHESNVTINENFEVEKIICIIMPYMNIFVIDCSRIIVQLTIYRRLRTGRD